MKKKFIMYLLMITAGVVLGLSTLFWFYDWYLMTGNSMEPTFYENDIVLARTSPGAYERGDIILFLPEDSDEVYSKRIAGMPGDVVEATKQGIWVNGKPFATVRNQGNGTFATVRVPQGQLFVLGDHPEVSDDSRHFGPVPLKRVLARVDWIVAPVSRMGRVPEK